MTADPAADRLHAACENRGVPSGQPESSDTDGWRAWWRERGERELRCILMTAWDPIGVGDTPAAWDEYDGYAPQIARALRETVDPDESAAQVARHLGDAERRMEMHTDQSRMANARLARSLVAWHEWSYLRGGSVLLDPNSPGISPSGPA